MAVISAERWPKMVRFRLEILQAQEQSQEHDEQQQKMLNRMKIDPKIQALIPIITKSSLSSAKITHIRLSSSQAPRPQIDGHNIFGKEMYGGGMSWSGTVIVVSSSTSSTKLTFEDIHNLILSEDIRRKTAGESSNSILRTEGRGRRQQKGNNRGNGGGGGNGRGRSKSRKRGVSKSRKDITCWNCKDKGHFKNQCPKPLQNNGTNEVHLTEDIHGDALLCAVDTITE
ncbi:hypothetical protein LXL04_037856 [Taraxacum kok-saghyz]